MAFLAIPYFPLDGYTGWYSINSSQYLRRYYHDSHSKSTISWKLVRLTLSGRSSRKKSSAKFSSSTYGESCTLHLLRGEHFSGLRITDGKRVMTKVSDGCRPSVCEWIVGHQFNDLKRRMSTSS